MMRTAARYIFFVMVIAFSFSIFTTTVPSTNNFSSTQTVYAQDTSDTSSSDDEDKINPADPKSCGDLGALGWVVCPFTSAAIGAVKLLDNLINDLLTINTKQIFDTSDQGSSGARYKQAWSVFRSIALGIVIIAALVIIICTAFGLEILDAYTIRKLLPRTLIAILGITLSWNILEFLIILTNDVGNGIRALIYLPFQGMEGISFAAAPNILLLGGLGAGLASLGLIGLLSLVVTALLAVLIAFLVLVLRELIIIMLVLFAPIGIACLILPGTRKGWQLWQNSLTVMLVVFPIISAFIAAGRVFSLTVSNGDQGGDIINQLIAFAAYVLPYFMLPFAFRMAGGVMATLGGITNDSSRGAFDRLKNFRSNTAKKRYSDAVAGKSALGRSPIGGMYRRVHLSDQGGFSPTARGRARYRAAERGLYNQTTAEMLKNDDGRAANHDEGNAAAIHAKSRGDFIEKYIQNGGSKDKAKEALAELEAGYGAKMGTSSMRIAAFRARAASSTAYKAGDYESMFNDAASLANDGIMTDADTVAAFKQNKARSDINGAGFNDMLSQVGRSRENLKNGRGALSIGEADAIKDSALIGSEPRDIVAGRHESVTALAPRMMENLRTTVRSGDHDKMIDELASVAAKYDAMSSISPKKAQIMRDHIMSQKLDIVNDRGEQMTVQEVMNSDLVRGDNRFLELRREYRTAMDDPSRRGGGPEG